MIEGYAVPDFISDFWHYYIAALTIAGILFSLWILVSQTTRKLAPGEQAEVMEHAWDGDLQELNNPLPRWWLYLFYFLIAFSVLYLVLYPGLGRFQGVWNWSSASQWQDEKKRVDAQFDQVFQPYLAQDVLAVAANPKAMETGRRLYLTYCSQCHGSDGQGSREFPNLTDGLWLWGGEPDQIRQSITNGFQAEMPALGDAVGGEAGAREVAHYVLSLGGRPHDAALAAAGKEKYAVCAGCHMEDGTGMAAAGFPNLVDEASRYGNTEAAIVESILKGRQGGMPSQAHLGEAKIHLLTAYVLSLSKRQ
jgi:cytochrome c oxidase cbb3-type subunit 3